MLVSPFYCRVGHIPSEEGNHLARVGRLAERQLTLDAFVKYTPLNQKNVPLYNNKPLLISMTATSVFILSLPEEVPDCSKNQNQHPAD